MTHNRLAATLFSVVSLLPLLAQAEEKKEAEKDVKTFEIVMKNHEFSPIELVVPAGENIKIIVKNQDKSPIEFESVHLKREKIIQPNGEVTLSFGPLKAGTYRYRDDFNEDAKGFITVK